MNFKMQIGLIFLTAGFFALPFSLQAHVPENQGPPAAASASEQGSSVNRGEEQQQAVVEQEFNETEREIRQVERELAPTTGAPSSESTAKINDAANTAGQVYNQGNDSERQALINQTNDIQLDVSIAKTRENIAKIVDELKKAQTPAELQQIQNRLQNEQRNLDTQKQLQESVNAAKSDQQ